MRPNALAREASARRRLEHVVRASGDVHAVSAAVVWPTLLLVLASVLVPDDGTVGLAFLDQAGVARP